jgi:hypothetical protein
LVLYSSMIFVVINIYYTNLKLKSSVGPSKPSEHDSSNTPEVSSSA